MITARAKQYARARGEGFGFDYSSFIKEETTTRTREGEANGQNWTNSTPYKGEGWRFELSKYFNQRANNQ